MARFRDVFERHKGPPVDIEAIVRALGIELDNRARLDPGISGQIERLPDGGYRISANGADHPLRRRFTVAHELGHYYYHAHLMGEGIDDNKAYRSTPDGRFYNTLIDRAEETEANKFAAGLLMPTDLVTEYWNRLRDPEEMAKLFQVSRQAMEIRLRGLKLTD